MARKSIVLHDRRLEGGAPIGPGITTLPLDAKTSLFSAFGIISSLARLDGVQRLYVLCHGYAGANNRAEVCGDFGGMGLQLGRENMLHSNVARWTALRGALSSIVIYACGAADTESNNVGTDADGRYLMGALAIHTEATVYAADRIQWYTRKGGTLTGTIDFGAWEGTLWKFKPDGSSSPAPGNRVPVEVGEA
jgi:hypothetical protein